MDIESGDMQVKQVEFTGKAGEYFSIWIVNVLLTILTLGVYSAWAKVRTKQYFYGNTLLDGASFRYLADPLEILKGRIIAVFLFVVYYFSGLISTTVTGVIVFLIALAVPLLVVMSMSFQLRNTSYRNIRFNFVKDYKRAYTIFAYPIIAVVSYFALAAIVQPDEFGQAGAEPQALSPMIAVLAIIPMVLAMLYPIWEYMLIRFKVTHSRFGTAEINFEGSGRSLFGIYMRAGLGLIGIIILASLLMGVLGSLFAPANGEEAKASPVFAIMGFLIIIPAYLWMFAYVNTKRLNYIFGNLDINGHRVQSDLRVMYMLYLYITNTLAMAISLGLLMPWAKVRTARYRAERTSIIAVSDFDGFIGEQASRQSAFGEEMGEVFDLDLGM